jgi:pyridinium-3,5-biscarboxylic acid mononucleotide sulfurtransferase
MVEMTVEISSKIESLKKWFQSKEGSIVAFSGGIDSSLVLFMARLVQGKDMAIAVISNSESLKNKDFELAKSFSEKYDIRMEVIITRELADDRYNENPYNRCFYCKEHLYKDIQPIRDKYPDFLILNGTNFDDYADFRPGLQAASQYNVHSPLADCKITKPELRQIAKYYELPNWDKPASPCLSSRIPYNHKITRLKLEQVEQAENFLNTFGFNDVRVRHYGDYGKIEVKQEELPGLFEIKDQVEKKMIELGFKRCEIDTEGLVSGKMNRILINSGSSIKK